MKPLTPLVLGLTRYLACFVNTLTLVHERIYVTYRVNGTRYLYSYGCSTGILKYPIQHLGYYLGLTPGYSHIPGTQPHQHEYRFLPGEPCIRQEQVHIQGYCTHKTV